MSILIKILLLKSCKIIKKKETQLALYHLKLLYKKIEEEYHITAFIENNSKNIMQDYYSNLLLKAITLYHCLMLINNTTITKKAII